jgi:uncharacterized protein (DUF924 family)
MMETPDTIRKYWFGTALEDAAVTARERAPLWWSKNPEVDNEIRRRFENCVIKAGSGELDHWASKPPDRLALILLMDQFPRSIYRDSARAFAFDTKALSWLRCYLAPSRKSFFLPAAGAFGITLGSTAIGKLVSETGR